MSETHDEIRALRVMVEELKADPPPELPWDAIEKRLLARVAARDAARVRARASWLQPDSALFRAVGICAAAAAIALGVSHAAPDASSEPRAEAKPVARQISRNAESRHIDPSAIGAAPGAAHGERDLRALGAGDVIEAFDAPITFSRAGLVAWTLAPRSAVRVRSMGDARSGGVGHTVALERGSIRAEVTPRDAAEGLVEAFVVEASKTRIAVHGTAFTVTLEDGRAVVDVEHGAVAIGPIGHLGATTGHLLVGPQRGSFSLDGARLARLLPRDPAPVAFAPLSPPSPPSAGAPKSPESLAASTPSLGAAGAVAAPIIERVAAAPQVQPVAAARVVDPRPSQKLQPEAPAAQPAPPALTIAAVRARVDQCFRSTYEPGSSSVQISVSSTLRVSLNPDGSVRSARFDPPLKPEMVSCAGGIMTGRFAEGTSNIDIPVSYKP